ncbi:TerB family tellurite resistance protein [Stigmatella sp. ncwal1]|uniref:TerB family tellurite resistance protein n=1 Tax=Stigmatella ashevillensis TaxID=2995309 RepID=A0ABT5D6A3_9BACT|nr:TerB family tellurite resistance protein [Stigmatella ashevillena]MDC0708393.1 TerB family tellurite resistance protein [Stigmatella ashevillena]
MAPGKVLGAMVGLMIGLWMGGPLSIVLCVFVGAVAGHFYDQANALPPEDPTEGLRERFAPPGAREPLSRAALDAQAQEHFARHLCALFIEVARADGDVVRDEVRVAREYFQNELKYGPEALNLVRRHLKAFLTHPPPLEESIEACREELPTGDRLLLVDALYHLALTDGPLQRSEQESLRQIAQGLGLTEEDRRAVALRYLAVDDTQYARLGLSPDASDAEVKRAYRQLAATHHPDRVAHLGQGAIEQATRRFQEINEAYEEIRRLRGL